MRRALRNDFIGFIAGVLAVLLLVYGGNYLIGCATTPQTAKQLDYQFMQGYMAQVNDYTQQVSRTDLTEDQKEILRQKRNILVQIYPLIKTYDQYVQNGQIPTAALQASIIDMLNELERLVTK